MGFGPEGSFPMSAELVFNAEGKARMVLRSQGWHKLAQVASEISLDLVHSTLGTDTEVSVSPLAYPDGQVSAFQQGVRWEGLELGTVGPNYIPLQNRSFVDSFQPWIDSGLAVVEGAGFLRSGAVLFLQLNPTKEEPIEVRPGDAVKSYIFAVNGHDGLTGMRAGSCNTRIVCANTLGVAMSEIKTEGLSRKHTGDVIAKMTDIQTVLLANHRQLLKQVEAYKFLDSVNVPDTATVHKFSRVLSGKSAELPVDFRPSAVDHQIELLFRHGRGNIGRSFWDLLNAATERNTYGGSSERKEENPGDNEGRRLDALWLGTLNTSNAKAMSTALSMAKAAA